ncbi:MAG: hypothetical protein ACKVN9_07565 [Methylophilaceae bacterium]
MPILPSGLGIAIGSQAIPDDMGANWFKCPEGHFWYTTPDMKITPPPYDGVSEILEDFVHAPVPKSIEEVKRYVYVLYYKPDGRFQWKGEWLSEFPQPGQLDDADLAAWNIHMNLEGTKGFLQGVIKRCERQAELNRHCSGVAFLSESNPSSP